MKQIGTCLWFDKEAEQAADFYTKIFKHSEKKAVTKYTDSSSKMSGMPKDSVMVVDLNIENMKVQALNGGPIFKHNPSMSYYISCDNEAELKDLWGKLSKDGSVEWELKKYEWSELYGWCNDKYGVSWQLILDRPKDKIASAFLFTGDLYGRGEEAMNFYMSLFKNSRVESMYRDPQTNKVAHAKFTLNDQEFVMMEGPGKEPMKPTNAFSFVINCEDQKEIDHYWEKLENGGTIEECGWLKDKFGVSWQVVPYQMDKMMSEGTPEQIDKVMGAMRDMKKLDLAKLESAYNSK